MRISIPIFTALLLLLGLAPSLYSQEQLQTLSIDFERQYRIDRAEAESAAVADGYPIKLIKPDGSTIELQRLNNGRPVYYKTDNVIAGKTISTDKVYPGGVAGLSLTGSGITLGEWDAGGVRATHQEFGGRVLNTEGALHFHSTHVAGTMIAAGVSSPARGMSYQANLKAYDWNNDDAEMAAQAGLGLRVSNHSYGLITGWDFGSHTAGRWAWYGDPAVSATEDYSFGYYDAEASNWDGIAHAAPYYLIVKSAGNDRDEGPTGSVLHDVFNGGWMTSTAVRSKDGNSGYDCLSASSVAKNLLVVAAVNDISGGWSSAAGVVMSSFSSWGPTDDGRIKPDISANGVSLNSTLETANNAYGSLSGTSMATPSVAGSIGLLLQHQQNLHGSDSLLASTVKGIILHTADEAGPNPGPDYMFGWGLMNTRKAADLMTLNSTEGDSSHIREYGFSTGDTVEFDFASTGDEPLRFTLCWTDIAVGLPPVSIDPPNAVLRNDLDMRIIRKSDGAVFYPWKCNPATPSAAATRSGDNARDNVEQVLIDAPGRTLYTLRITHKSTIANGPALASLIMSGNTSTLGASIAASEDSLGYSKVPGAVFADSITIYNNGDSLMTGSITTDLPSFWLSLTEDSVNVPSLDSTVIHFTVDGSLWSQWTAYEGAITVSTNDPFNPEMVVPVAVSVLGPTYSGSPASILSDLDSAEVGYDTLMVRNTGFTPLDVVVSDSLGALPSWITAGPDTFSVAPGDSVAVALTLNALDEPLGDYATTIKVSHNDSTTGPDYIPVRMNIGTRMLFELDVADRWNIISLPVDPVDGLKTALFPSATTFASGFNGAYYQADTLRPGPGYWLKFPAGGTHIVDGYSFDLDTIPLLDGWNMVGSLFEPLAVSAVTTEPPGIIGSAFYQYDDGYAPADSIIPGRGYWVKADGAGEMYLSLLPGAAPKAGVKFAAQEYDAITIAGSAGGTAKLYFADGNSPAPKSALPPRPPAGAFDARFSDDNFFTSFTPTAGDERQTRTILVAGAGSEVRVTARFRKENRTEYSIDDGSGTLHPLKDGATVRIRTDGDGGTSLRLVAGGDPLPKEFGLGQNFPNPFNPSTKVSFSLPTEADVTIRLFNVLGNEVATIAERKYVAGRHEVEFNAQNLPSGVYIYTMQAGTFTASKKMVLMR